MSLESFADRPFLPSVEGSVRRATASIKGDEPNHGSQRCAASRASGLRPRSIGYRGWAWARRTATLGLLLTIGCGTSQPKLPDDASDLRSAERGRVEAAEAGAERGRAEVETAEERSRRERRESGLVGVVWQWTRFVDPMAGGIDVPEPQRYRLEFFDDGSVSIVADCNRGRGTYLLDENELAIRVVALSDRPCGSRSLGREFVDNLGATTSYYLVNQRLLLSQRWDTGTMELAPRRAADDP